MNYKISKAKILGAILLGALTLSQAQNYTIQTIAGTLDSNSNYDQGLSSTSIISSDLLGNLYIADANQIKILNPNHPIKAFGNADSLNIKALVSDSKGNLYSTNGQSISLISSSGIRTVLANQGGNSLALNPLGSLYFATSTKIAKIDSNGNVTVIAGSDSSGIRGDNGSALNALFQNISSIVIDKFGQIYVSQSIPSGIRKIDSNGIVTSLVLDTNLITNPHNLSLDQKGNLLVFDAKKQIVLQSDSTGTFHIIAGSSSVPSDADGILALNAGFKNLQMMVSNGQGQFFLLQTPNSTNLNVIRTFDLNGILETALTAAPSFDGDGGPATRAHINHPSHIALDHKGNIYFSDVNNHRIRKINNQGIISTVVGNGQPGSQGDGDWAINASITSPQGMVIDRSGNLIFSDSIENRVRKVDSNGIISTIFGMGGCGWGADGTLAIKDSTCQPTDIVIDSHGNLLIAEAHNLRVVKIDSNGILHPYAGNGQWFGSEVNSALNTALWTPSAIGIDAKDNLFIFETQGSYPRMDRVDSSGSISPILIQSGSPSGTVFNGLAIASNGRIIMSSAWLNEIIAQDSVNEWSTLAGYLPTPGNGDQGLAKYASLNSPSGLAVDSSGSIYIADTYNNLIRKISPIPAASTSSNDSSTKVNLIDPNRALNGWTKVMNVQGVIVWQGNLQGQNLSTLSLDKKVYWISNGSKVYFYLP